MKHLSKLITRPQREKYSEMEMGPKRFVMKNRLCQRKDLDVMNSRGHILKCSWFMPGEPPEQMDVIIYCHGNCGSRLDSIPVVEKLLPHEISVFTFDFSGCGMSEGDQISLGWYEKDDISTVMDLLRKVSYVRNVGLWGRSMGAATALQYASTDPTLFCLVLDSAFANLALLWQSYAKRLFIIPETLAKVLIHSMRKNILKQAKFDLFEVNPVQNARDWKIPAIFLHATNDKVVPLSNMTQLFSAYGGFKLSLSFKGGHNSIRPNAIVDEAINFIINGQKSYQMITTPRGNQKLPSFSVEARKQLYDSQHELQKTVKKEFVAPTRESMERLIVK